MKGKNIGLQALLKNLVPGLIWNHCMVHRGALACKKLSPKLHEVLKNVIKGVNIIKKSSVCENI